MVKEHQNLRTATACKPPMRDELTKTIKPWYDNYCFAIKRYGKTTMYNSVMVLNFLDNYIRNEYDIPDSMVETNIRIDYDKIRMLIRHDKNGKRIGKNHPTSQVGCHIPRYGDDCLRRDIRRK